MADKEIVHTEKLKPESVGTDKPGYDPKTAPSTHYEAPTALLEETEEQKEHKKNIKRREEDKKRSQEEAEKARKELHVKLQDILHEYDGQESNIPVTHGYWDMMNQFRALSKTVGPDYAHVEKSTLDQIKAALDDTSADSASAKKAFERIRALIQVTRPPDVPPEVTEPVGGKHEPATHKSGR